MHATRREKWLEENTEENLVYFLKWNNNNSNSEPFIVYYKLYIR